MAADLSHSAERQGSVAAGFVDEALFRLPAGVRSQPATSRARRRSPPSENEHCCLCRCSQRCCSCRCPPASLLQGSGPTLFCRSAGGENPGKMLRERALQKKNHLLSSASARAAGSWPSLSPPPSALAAPPSSAPRQQQNPGPRWVQALGSGRLAVLTLVAALS